MKNQKASNNFRLLFINKNEIPDYCQADLLKISSSMKKHYFLKLILSDFQVVFGVGHPAISPEKAIYVKCFWANPEKDRNLSEEISAIEKQISIKVAKKLKSEIKRKKLVIVG